MLLQHWQRLLPLMNGRDHRPNHLGPDKLFNKLSTMAKPDATPVKMAAIILFDPMIKVGPVALLEALKLGQYRQDQVDILQRKAETSLPIIEAEIRALFLALEKLMADGLYGRYLITLYTDSMPALYFMKKGSSRFKTWDDRKVCELLTWRNRFDTYFDLDIYYVDTKVNPADYYSRT